MLERENDEKREGAGSSHNAMSTIRAFGDVLEIGSHPSRWEVQQFRRLLSNIHRCSLFLREILVGKRAQEDEMKWIENVLARKRENKMCFSGCFSGPVISIGAENSEDKISEVD